MVIELAKNRNQDFKISDIGLAEWGEKEIGIAETEMPGLMAMRKEFGSKKPLQRSPNCWVPAYDHSNSSCN